MHVVMRVTTSAIERSVLRRPYGFILVEDKARSRTCVKQCLIAIMHWSTENEGATAPEATSDATTLFSQSSQIHLQGLTSLG